METDESAPPATSGLKPASLILFLATLAALAAGIYLCLPQLSETPIYLWLFVIDIPVFAFLGGLLVLWHFPRNDTWEFIVGSGLVIYGIWSALVLLLNAAVYFAPDQAIFNILLLIGAVLMVVEGLMVLPSKATKTMLIIALVVFALNSLVDYQLGPLSAHPRVPEQNMGLLDLFTWVAGVAVPVLFYYSCGWLHARTRKLHHVFCWMC